MNRPQVIAAIADSVVRLPAARPVRVGIDGRSAAGKTTLADELAVELRSRRRPCLRASIDDFHPPGYQQRAAAGDFTPESYLAEGYDQESFRRLVLDPVAPGTILVVDGVFLLLPTLRDQWDLTIWLQIDWQTMLSRAERRDVAWVGSPEGVRARYQQHWIPRHELYERLVDPERMTDIVVDNNDVDHPVVIRARR